MIENKKYYNNLENFLKSNDNSDVTDLHLDENGQEISEEKAYNVSITLTQCKNLVSLTLFFYRGFIGDKGVSYLATALSQIPQIKQLELSLLENEISDEGAKAVGINLGKLKNLTQLDLWLYSNKFGDIGALEVAKGLSECLQIQKLSIGIGSNMITYDGYLKLDQCLSSLPNLLNLYCYLRDGEQLLKQREIFNCKNIKILTLAVEYNNIDRNGDFSFEDLTETMNNEWMDDFIQEKYQNQNSQILIKTISIIFVQYFFTCCQQIIIFLIDKCEFNQIICQIQYHKNQIFSIIYLIYQIYAFFYMPLFYEKSFISFKSNQYQN
ncbi:transmembrane protein, putative (macronuclear) [Tetrahymena thermophila SB210]|uniref:Transmembrane protein, putative n=1 Tax=Tetrahymena thermophila (strain SB210) TaxID=312017 RepID=Q22SQ1_TETTS|nr:transmembrane protein, putative [Tetrahymena thermophila SB210]EAR88324.2 transmembrane protein, putative [Tetrahymena thermophila SB210]|eukprot:XP_001008569.2 transmembrane protein, putative [Tetrahymena thermophila SB210]